MNSRKERIEFAELVLFALQGDIDEEQSRRLRQTLENDPQAISLYTDLVEIYSELSSFGHVRITPSSVAIHRAEFNELNDLMQMLAEEEEISPVKIIEKQPALEEKEIVAKLERPAVQKKINKVFVWITFTSLAALLLLIVYFNLSFFNPVEVATVTDSIRAEYASETFVKGSRLTNRTGRYYLEEGISSIQFDSGAAVVIEAPAEFELKSRERMVLYSGRLYANVPQQAIGFTVKTLDSTVIDLGTEFAIYAVPMHGTELHVFKGKTEMVLRRSDAVLVTEGQAQRVEASSGRVQTIAPEESRFVHKISSESGLVWRGQRVISLNDLVTGGDGYGSSLQTYANFDPNTGSPTTIYSGLYEKIGNGYRSISSTPLLDGVFVPNGKNQVISSEGHVFADCPDTTGFHFAELSFDEGWKFFPEIAQRYNRRRQLGFDQSMLLIHSNLGTTIDLNAIRRQFPGQFLRGFKTTVGTAYAGTYGPIGGAEKGAPAYTEFDVWILVDGQLRSAHRKVRWDSLIDIDVPVTSGDRFLSIVVTEGQTVHPDGNPPTHYDLCALADPRFEVECTE